MGIILKIAVRNLRQHKVKTLIIGSIVALGIAVLVVGNSMMDTASAGIRKTFIENYTGEIMISAPAQAEFSIFGNLGPGVSDEPVPRLPDYFRLVELASAHPAVAGLNPQATGRAMLAVGETGRGFTQLFGIDPAKYRAMFPDNLELLSGEFLKPGDEGILLSESAVEMLKSSGAGEPAPGSKVLLTNVGPGAGIAIREATVRGVFRFKNVSTPQLSFVSLVDVQNLRALLGYTVTANLEARLSDEQKAFVKSSDENSLFEGGISISEAAPAIGRVRDFENILGDTSLRDKLAQTDTGAWQYLLLRLKPGADPEAVMADLRAEFQKNGLELRVSGWLAGAGPVAGVADTMKNAFNLIVLIIAVVAVIIIMNTLVISVSERISEIGTMRAIGAGKSFVRAMITWETMLVAGLFGLLGLAAGTAVLLILNATGINAPNLFIQILFGGKILRPVLSPGAAAASLAVVVLIGVLASLYPVRIALKIPPVRAMQTE